MLLIDKCTFTTRSFREVKKKIECYNPKSNDRSYDILSKKRYNIIIIGIDFISDFELCRKLKYLLIHNYCKRLLIVSNINWPKKMKPLKICDGVYLAGRSDISSLLDLYIKNKEQDYFNCALSFSWSIKERKILEMILDQNDRWEMCDILNVKDKTISSHISNIKKKVSVHSYLHLIMIYKLNITFFK